MSETPARIPVIETPAQFRSSPKSDLKPNIPLLRKVVEWVEEQAVATENREWYQASWITSGIEVQDYDDTVNWCETACCVAGKVALMEGYKPETEIDGTYTGEVYDPQTGITHSTESVARKALGLTETEGMWLFSPINKAADIREIAEHLAGERL